MAAGAEALFPEAPGAVDHREAELVARTEAYVLALPPTQAPMVQLMFVALEWVTPLLSPFGPRFSGRAAVDRLHLIEHWREGWFLPARLLADAARATLVMVYISHPAVMRRFGEPPEGHPMIEAP